jgi:hypothetical protein
MRCRPRNLSFYLVGLIASAVVALMIGALQNANAAGRTEILAKTGDLAPDGNGRFLELDYNPTINAAGQVAFWGSLADATAGAGEGIFLWDENSLIQLVRSGQPAPNRLGGVSGTFSNLNNAPPALNAAGFVAFQAQLAGTGSGSGDNAGNYRVSDNSIVEIARLGQSPPSGSGSFTFLDLPYINASGQVAFNSFLAGTGATGSVDAAFRSDGVTTTELAREGQPTSGGTLNSAITSSFNSLGQAVLTTRVVGTPGTQNAIYRADGGPLTEIARQGQPAGSGLFNSFSDALINDVGQAAFVASLTGTARGTLDDSGIFLGNGSTITTIAREGQAVASGELGHLGDFMMNSAGQVSFGATTRNAVGGTTGEGIFRGDGNQLTAIALTGQQAPGGTGSFSQFLVQTMNSRGHIAFTAQLQNGPNLQEALILSDGSNLIEVARVGMPLLGSTVTQIVFNDWINYVYNDDHTGLNQHDQVVYRASLADGRQAIVLFTPECQTDLNDDGLVNRSDIAVFAQKYGTVSGAICEEGDFNFDGAIDLADLAMLQSQFEGPSLSLQAEQATVPEPSTLMLAGLGLVAVASLRIQGRNSRGTFGE